MNFEQSEKRLHLFLEMNWTCEVCGSPIVLGIPQLAHRINQSKTNLKKYGKDIIHHKENLAVVCSLKCNQKISLYGKIESIKKLIKKIKCLTLK